MIKILLIFGILLPGGLGGLSISDENKKTLSTLNGTKPIIFYLSYYGFCARHSGAPMIPDLNVTEPPTGYSLCLDFTQFAETWYKQLLEDPNSYLESRRIMVASDSFKLCTRYTYEISAQWNDMREIRSEEGLCQLDGNKNMMQSEIDPRESGYYGDRKFICKIKSTDEELPCLDGDSGSFETQVLESDEKQAFMCKVIDKVQGSIREDHVNCLFISTSGPRVNGLLPLISTCVILLALWAS